MEDAEAVAGRFAGMMAEFSPSRIAGGVLVKRAAMLSVRLDRSYEQEAAHLSARVDSAETALADKRLTEAERLIQEIRQHPATNYRRLMMTPEGVEKLTERWVRLKAGLDNPDGCQWFAEHEYWADSLTGRLAGNLADVSPFHAWTMAIHGDFSCLEPEELAGLETPEDKSLHAMDRVADLVDAEVARLRAHRASMDTRAVEAERSTAARRALFDPSPEAVLARRYEAAAARDFHRCLAELRQVEAEAEARIPNAVAEAPEDAAVPAQVVGQEKVEEEASGDAGGSGSFGQGAPSVTEVEEPDGPARVVRSIPHRLVGGIGEVFG